MATSAVQTYPGGSDPDSEIQELQGYRSDRVRLALAWCLVAATGGLFLIPITWRAGIKLRLTMQPCALAEADAVLITDGYGQTFEEKVVKERKDKAGFIIPTHLMYKRIKYVWDQAAQNFVRLSFLHPSTRCSELCEDIRTGLSHEENMRRIRLYGENYINIKAPSILRLIYEQGVNPFYIMQLYSLLLWFFSGYVQFAIALMVVTSLSIGLTVWEARRQTKALRKHIKSQMKVVTLRNGHPLEKSSRDLVPGEVVILSGDCPFSLDCDVVLLKGDCVVDESSLTGESHPLYKVPLLPDYDKTFDMEHNSQNTVLSGTTVLQVKGNTDVLAVVVRTGFDTQKGSLVRSILFPKPVDFQFYADFSRYVLWCLVLGLVAACYSAYVWTANSAPVSTVVLFSLDMITFVVPVILPMNLSALYAFSQRRLKRSGIYCLCAKYILLCGGLDVFCFDKTGTLTESELCFGALVPAGTPPDDGGNGDGDGGGGRVARAEFQESLTELAGLDCRDVRLPVLAACHGLTLMDGRPNGDPLDLPLFNAVGWELFEQEPASDPDFSDAPVTKFVRPVAVGDGGVPSDHDVAVYKQFPFTAASRRCTVLARRRFGAGLDVYIKGAPEALVSLCDPTTVPGRFQDVLDWYTSQGLRVVGLACKPLSPQLGLAQAEKMEQGELEEGAEFLGLAVLHNAVLASSYKPLEQLHAVGITPVMITGDNLLTSVNVARESGLVQKAQTILRVDVELVPSSVNAAQHLRITYSSPETARAQTFLKSKQRSVHGENYVFVIDGKSFELLWTFDRRMLRTIVHRCRVFGRMTPQQKVQIIETLQDLGHQVGMCGDGCNDCGALRTAHAGLSLSRAEPSAAAPFTSRTGTVAGAPELVREGRAALVTSFALFKTIFSTGLLVMFLALILYTVGCEPLSPHYIIMVLVIGAPAPFAQTYTAAADRLCRRRPPTHLTDPVQVASSLSFVLLQCICLLAVYHYTAAQPWFQPASVTTEPITTFYTMDKMQPTFESSALFVAMNLVYIMSWVTFSPGAPYRKPFYTNRPLLVLILLALVTNGFVMFYRGSVWTTFLKMMYAPYAEYYLVVAAFVTFMGMLSYIWEVYVIQGYPGIKLADTLRRLRRNKLPFELIEEDLKEKKDWPPLKQSEDITVDDETCKTAVDPPPSTEKAAAATTTAEEIYASGILKKPSFRLPSPWKVVPPTDRGSAEPASAAVSESSGSGGAGTFGTFRPSSRLAPVRESVSHRPSIILEEVVTVTPTMQPATADSVC